MKIRSIDSNESQIIHQCAEIISCEHAWQVYGIDLNRAVKILSSMPDQIYVAEKNGIVQGFVTLRLQGVGNIGAYVRMLAVHPNCRRQSIGCSLINYIQQEAEKRGDRNLFLICSTDNSSASNFYKSIGFEQVGILSDLVITGHDEILYRKTN